MSASGIRQAGWVAVGTLLLLAASDLAAQEKVSQFSVRASHPQARFTVDGRIYTGAATFLWTEGSTHVLDFFLTDGGYQYTRDGRTRFEFSEWRDSEGLLRPSGQRTQVVVANSKITVYTLEVSAEYDVFVQFYDPGLPDGGSPPTVCTPPGPVAPDEARPGVVFIDDICLWRSAHLWLEAGPHVINAFPYPGFAFVGWTLSTGGSNAFLRTLTLAGPLIVTANFRPAKRITFRTEPPGLTVLLDRTPTPTPLVQPCHQFQPLPVSPPVGLVPMCAGEVDWALHSRHVIGADSPQTDRRGKLWIFGSFSNGMGNHAGYKVDSLAAEVIVARFVPGARVSFLTDPTGLKLTVNGRDNWPSYNFVAKAGDKFAIAAPGQQVGPDGRRYVFRGWSNGGEATQAVTIPPEAIDAGFRVTASYDMLSQVVVHSDPAGASVDVDGTPCPTPCTVDRADGTQVRLAVPDRRVISHAHRLDFESWSDGGARERTVKVTGRERVDLTARYTTYYRLETLSQPPGGAAFELQPSSPEGYFQKGVYVTVTAKAGNGYRFRRWGGDLEGTYPTVGVTMSAPRQVVALLDAVPYIAPAGIRNAAGETPDPAVAPGSIISIYGASLAHYPELGQLYPMAQTLGGATVRLGDRLLALYYAAPEQINALLPYDLPEGSYSLTINRAGQPDVTGDFQVARNAPGIFGRIVETKNYALALHEDGSPILPDSPARRGELVSIYATGLGPYDKTPPYGFALPSSPRYLLVDFVEVLARDLVLRHEFAGGATALAGMDLLKIRIGEEIPRTSTVELRVRVAGRESNSVLLPVE